MSSLSIIWENTDGCAYQYICASKIYLMSDMYQCYSVITDCGIIVPGQGKEVIDGLNEINKHCIHKLVSNVQLPE